EKQKANLDDILRKQKGKLVILIDEIDRLSTTELLQLFQAVKAIASFPNTVYVLAFDFDRVAKEIGGADDRERGKHYLEKIIQIPFSVPETPIREVYKYTATKLKEIIEGWNHPDFDPGHFSDITGEDKLAFISSLREAKRFLNVFSFAG